MNPMNSNNIYLATLQAQRANDNQPFMVPAKLNNQLRVNDGTTKLDFVPMGQTSSGGIRWGVSWLPKLQRPGNIDSTIKSKGQQARMAKITNVTNGQIKSSCSCKGKKDCSCKKP